MKRPPIDRVFWTAPIGQVAVARRDGGIHWADEWGDQQGILLWEHQQEAADWQIARSGRPVVVVEITRADIQTQSFQPVQAPELRLWARGRLWISGRAIQFSRVWWHTYREDLAQPAGWYELDLPQSQPQASEWSGTIQLTPEGAITAIHNGCSSPTPDIKP